MSLPLLLIYSLLSLTATATGGGVTIASNQRLHAVYHLRNIIIRTGILN